MKKILGIDIGTNSIGWAIVCEPENENESASILKTGVRIIKGDDSHIREYEQGKAVTLNASRRVKRGMRRNNHRFKLRRKKLVAILREAKMIENTTEVLQIGNGDPLYLYSLRNKAANGEKLSLFEIGRIFYQFNLKRGYKSNRKANTEEKEVSETESTSKSKEVKKGLLDQIADREAILKNQNWTVGQFFYRIRSDAPAPG